MAFALITSKQQFLNQCHNTLVYYNVLKFNYQNRSLFMILKKKHKIKPYITFFFYQIEICKLLYIQTVLYLFLNAMDILLQPIKMIAHQFVFSSHL